MSCKCDTINIVNDNNVIVVSHADGRDGKSAYQQAVEGGYTGTEQDFNCSLSLLADVKQVKENLVSAIEYKGGTSNAEKSFQGIAEDIKEIPNFNTNGCEYISEDYKPTTLLDAYINRYYLNSVVDNYVEEISGGYAFQNCLLQKVELPNLATISGNNVFQDCSSLQNVQMPSLVTISGISTFQNCTSLHSVELPSLVTIGTYTFRNCTSLQNVQLPNVMFTREYVLHSCTSLQNVQLGTLIQFSEPFSQVKQNLRNITLGQGTDINLPFQNWTATNVINEGQSAIDELNSNLYNNLLTKLYDHSTDGQTRTLRLGWLAHVTQENIDYANSKGWTLTT